MFTNDSSREDRKLVVTAKKKQQSTSKQLNDEWSMYNLEVCDNIVRNRLSAAGFIFCNETLLDKEA